MSRFGKPAISSFFVSFAVSTEPVLATVGTLTSEVVAASVSPNISSPSTGPRPLGVETTMSGHTLGSIHGILDLPFHPKEAGA